MQQQELGFLEQRNVLSVSELIAQIRDDLEPSFRDLWIQGEISNLRRPPSGHIYFTLKDGESQISAVCFRMQRIYLKFEPEDGLDVLVRGSVTLYPPRGQLQVAVQHMEPVGRGALQLAFEKLKAKLAAEGLFDKVHKKPLPLVPERIGIVTSPSGAAVQDILRVLKRRNDRLNVLIYPAKVQGEGAAVEVAEGIRTFNRRADVDVIIVARGGGSLEDLWAFNDEALARVIFASEIPVISAVGHEIDFTIADFVADERAATPSVAAEIVTGRRADLTKTLLDNTRRLAQAFNFIIHSKRRSLERLAASRAFVGAENKLRMFIQRLDELQVRLTQTLPGLVQPRKQRLTQVLRDLAHELRFYFQKNQSRLDRCREKLQAFSPLQVLERGYAIVTAGSGIVRDPEQVADEEVLDVRVAKGRFSARKVN